MYRLQLILLLCLCSTALYANSTPQFVNITADFIHTTYTEGKPIQTIATGNVHIIFEDSEVTAQKAVYSHETNHLELSGNVMYISSTQRITGDSLKLDSGSKRWSAFVYSVTVQPETSMGYLIEPLYLNGREINKASSGVMTASDTIATTCNLHTPHYEFESKSVVITPGKNIVLRNASLYFRNKRLYTLPKLVIPLTGENDPRIIPLFGQSDEEGYFLKTAYSYTGKGDQTGLFLLDLMSKKGIGEGIDHRYKTSKDSGHIRLYHLFDQTIGKNSFEGSMTHSTTVGDFKADASTDFRSNSYLYAPDSKTINERLSFSRSKGEYNTRISITNSINDSYSRTARLSGSLEHSQPLGGWLSLDSDFSYSGYTSGSYDESKLTSNIGFKYNIPEADIHLSTYRFTDFKESESSINGFYGTEKLPELYMQSNSQRLGISLLPGKKMDYTLAYGKYLEMPSINPVERIYVQAQLPVVRRSLGGPWSISDSTGYQQYFYSDNTAQYNLEHYLQIERKYNKKSSFTITHRYQRPEGYTPMRLDYLSKYNSLLASINMKDSSVLRYKISTGYDFEEDYSPWQDVLLQAWFIPAKSVSLYTSTGYDLNSSKWRTLINQLNIKPGKEFNLGIGTRYNTVRKQWALIRTVMDTKIDKLTRLQLINNYNGSIKQTDYSAIRLTRDLHCWEASLTYTKQQGFYSSEGIMFNLRLKALPFYPSFGTGQYGQALDSTFDSSYPE